ncbi:MAG: HlyC/CorC family transporter [Clostridia bacterium]|nr:HlyC/CorC family transporter [Clostridia bacterium]MBR4099749.1 HlyC/CorC family transporter [Clostridia bacterium]
MISTLRFVAIFLLILVSAFFSATEIAFSSVNALRLKNLKKEKETISRLLAVKILDDYDNLLSSILIGNNIANMASSSIATVVIIGWWGESYAWASTVIMTLLVLIFGEIIPKVLAKQFPELFCCFASIPMYALSVIFKPINFVIMGFVNLVSRIWQNSADDSEAVSEDDFENIIDIVEDEGVLDEEQCDLLQNALDFDEVLAYEIITHRVDMDALDIRDPYEVNLRKCEESTYSRLPVYEDTTDNIIGILHLNHFYKTYVEKGKVNIRELLLPVSFVHKTMPLPDVLEKMKENKCHMVVVLDEYGGTMGILTMEDVLEQLVGEIFDESDEIEREFIAIDDTHFEADGDMRVYDFFDEFDIDIDEDEDFEADTATVGGWTQTMLDGEAQEGDSFKWENLEITVLKTDGLRIERIAVEELPVEEEED